MNKGYITDHADRTWCLDPRSPEWWKALWRSDRHQRIMDGTNYFQQRNPRVCVCSISHPTDLWLLHWSIRGIRE
jgi:hypothetical protein